MSCKKELLAKTSKKPSLTEVPTPVNTETVLSNEKDANEHKDIAIQQTN